MQCQPLQTSLQYIPSFDQSPPTKKRRIQVCQKPFFLLGNKIYILTSSKKFDQLLLKLTSIAEAITRPAHINQFQINKQSLLRAKSLNKSRGEVVEFLSEHMRNKRIPSMLQKMLEEHLADTKCCRLYLQQQKQRNTYLFQTTLLDSHIVNLPEIEKWLILSSRTIHQDCIRYSVQEYKHNQLSRALFQYSIPVLSENIIQHDQIKQDMKRNAELLINVQAMHCKNLRIELKAFTKLRDYQHDALKTVVSQKDKQIVAKSGYVVLPCGAGKTLLGIAICAKINKQALIVCSSDQGADQWKREIIKWSQGIAQEQIIILTAKNIDDYSFNIKDSKAHIYISTYSNLKSKLEGKVKNEHEWIKRMPWGLIIFDQVQWLPAEGNSTIANSLLAHVKIGLTATPLRQDNEIKTLVYMIGPQLYVGSWKKFIQMGYLANPKCLEIRTQMTKTFSKMYKEETQQKKRQILYQTNPNKIKALVYLLQYHKRLNDNILIYCDKLSLIFFLTQKLKIPYLSGKVSNEDRNFVFDQFRKGVFKAILLSRIGDQAIDLPNANVAIQIDMLKGSRRQTLQRLGRIMRPKQASSSQSYNAIFYTILSANTSEMKYFQKRKDCLVDSGFQYDLRFFEYDADVSDIYKQDKSEIKIAAQAKYNEYIPDEMAYWKIITNTLAEDDLDTNKLQ